MPIRIKYLFLYGWLLRPNQLHKDWARPRVEGCQRLLNAFCELLEREVDGPVDEVEQEEEGRERHEKVEVWDSTDLRVSCQLNIRKYI